MFSTDSKCVRENCNLFILFEQRGNVLNRIYNDFHHNREITYDNFATISSLILNSIQCILSFLKITKKGALIYTQLITIYKIEIHKSKIIKNKPHNLPTMNTVITYIQYHSK